MSIIRYTDTDLLTVFETFPYFTVEGFKQIWEERKPGSHYPATVLYRWMKSGKLIQLKKGVYMSRRFYERHVGEPDFLPAVSSILLPQSYVTLEYVLQRFGVLTEITYPITAVTLKNTRVIQNRLGTFAYRHLKPGLYQGFSIREYRSIPFAMASMAKALFDYLYYRPVPAKLGDPDYNLAEDLRLNLDLFSAADCNEFARYVLDSRLPKMERLLRNFEITQWQH